MLADNIYSKGFIIEYKDGDRSIEREKLASLRDGDKTYIIKDNDSLTAIANHFYGNPNKWYIIADVNDIFNPFLLETGEILIIPDLKRYNS